MVCFRLFIFVLDQFGSQFCLFFLACFGSFQVILGQFGAYFEPFWLVLIGFFSFWVNVGLLLCHFLLNLGFFGSFLLILCSLWLF